MNWWVHYISSSELFIGGRRMNVTNVITYLIGQGNWIGFIYFFYKIGSANNIYVIFIFQTPSVFITKLFFKKKKLVLSHFPTKKHIIGFIEGKVQNDIIKVLYSSIFFFLRK